MPIVEPMPVYCLEMTEEEMKMLRKALAEYSKKDLSEDENEIVWGVLAETARTTTRK